MNYVIGSGPAGVSAASALLSRGLSVTLLDAGAELESGLQEKSDDLGRRLSETWHEDERTVLRGALRYTSEGAPLKLRYGSDYAYRDAGDHQPMTKSRVEAYRSFAMGGLSALWGASVLPYNQDDLADWPISQDELKSHYAAVLNLTGLSAERDELSSVYPLFIDPTASLNSSRQAQALLTRMRSHATDLARAHFHFGKSRLAITRSLGAAAACEHCGLCLYGCPYGFIYTSQETLRDMMRNSNRFTYVPGYLVQSLRESGGTVEINAVSIATGESAVFESSRVYLAAGVFSSTRILLESLKAYDRPVTMTQSENFLLPLLMTQSFSGVASERLHTLSQVFLELNDRSISTHCWKW